MGRGRNYSKDEEMYIIENYGQMSVKNIAKKLGRSVDAIKLKARKLGLNSTLEHCNYIVVNQIAKAFRVSSSHTVKDYWIDKLNLPYCEMILVETKKMRFIDIDEFWRWAEKNKSVINFAKLEKNMLGKEPKWVEEKRQADISSVGYQKRSTKWSPQEEAMLISMLRLFRYTYSDISQRIGRTEVAIKKKITDMGLKERPIKSDDHRKWTENEKQIAMDMHKKGYKPDVIGKRIGRSGRGVQRKIELIRKEVEGNEI